MLALSKWTCSNHIEHEILIDRSINCSRKFWPGAMAFAVLCSVKCIMHGMISVGDQQVTIFALRSVKQRKALSLGSCCTSKRIFLGGTCMSFFVHVHVFEYGFHRPTCHGERGVES